MTRPGADTGAAIFTLILVGALAPLLRFPPINDVTTTPDEPPVYRTAPPGDVAYPGAFADLQRRAYPDLQPPVRDEPPDETFLRAAAAAREMPGWEVVLEDDSLRIVQAVVATPLLRFRDDVVVEVRPAEAGSEVHVRSRSRWGRADFGTNARRIRSYLEQLR